jgi:transposase
VSTFLSSPKALVLFFDEGRFGLQATPGRCWARKRVRAHVRVKTGYSNFYIYSAVSPYTGESFDLILPWVNTEIMNIYLEHLSREYPDRELMLIMDQAGWHSSKTLKVPHNITIELLPPYSPELNPVEKLWQWLRRHACRNRLFKTEQDLIDALIKAFKQLCNSKRASLCACSYL